MDSPGDESDGAGSDLDRLPDDSSSDDDMAGPTGMLARAAPGVAPNHYMPRADPRMLPHVIPAGVPAGWQGQVQGRWRLLPKCLMPRT